MRWPIDPRTARTRDELTIVRALLATPLRVDERGDVVAGLCRSWRTRNARVWTLRCRNARRVARAVPFGRAAARGDVVTIRLPFRWLRFPYLLTSPRAAVPGTAGPFRLETTGRGHGFLSVTRGGLHLEFRQLEAHEAATQFRRGELDEAPVPLGDIRAAQLDPVVAPYVRLTPLLAVDAVVFDVAHGSLAGLVNTRRAYWQTAGRGDYQALVPEERVPAAVSLVPGYAPSRAKAAAFRAARRRISTLPPLPVGIGAGPGMAYGRDLLVALWRDFELRARAGGRDAVLRRLQAPYPQDEGVLAALYLEERTGLPGRGAFLDALGRPDQTASLRRADDALFDGAAVVPVSWAADARFVAPRLEGWREDRTGVVDYSRVRFRASSRRP